MINKRCYLSLVVVITALLSFSAAPLMAEEGRGLGGTGRSSQEPPIEWLNTERGFGGTGKTLSGSTIKWVALEEGGRGLGGTGRQAVGIIGTITAFGSIWVNGVEVELNDQTQLRVDQQLEQASALRVGQQVKVLSYLDNGIPTAAEVWVEHLLVDQVSAIRTSPRELVVAGQTVRPAPASPGEWPALKTGDWVKVSGYQSSNGALFATDVRQVAAPKQWLQRGRLQLNAKGQLSLAGIPLNEAQRDGFRVGERVVVSGVVSSDGQRVVRQIERENAQPFGDQVSGYLIEQAAGAGGEGGMNTPTPTPEARAQPAPDQRAPEKAAEQAPAPDPAAEKAANAREADARSSAAPATDPSALGRADIAASKDSFGNPAGLGFGFDNSLGRDAGERDASSNLGPRGVGPDAGAQPGPSGMDGPDGGRGGGQGGDGHGGGSGGR